MAKKKNPPKIVYFEDELNDDFAGTKIKTKTIDSSFKFVRKNPLWRFFSCIPLHHGYPPPRLPTRRLAASSWAPGSWGK